MSDTCLFRYYKEKSLIKFEFEILIKNLSEISVVVEVGQMYQGQVSSGQMLNGQMSL